MTEKFSWKEFHNWIGNIVCFYINGTFYLHDMYSYRRIYFTPLIRLDNSFITLIEADNTEIPIIGSYVNVVEEKNKNVVAITPLVPISNCAVIPHKERSGYVSIINVSENVDILPVKRRLEL